MFPLPGSLLVFEDAILKAVVEIFDVGAIQVWNVVVDTEGGRNDIRGKGKIHAAKGADLPSLNRVTMAERVKTVSYTHLTSKQGYRHSGSEVARNRELFPPVSSNQRLAKWPGTQRLTS